MWWGYGWYENITKKDKKNIVFVVCDGCGNKVYKKEICFCHNCQKQCPETKNISYTEEEV